VNFSGRTYSSWEIEQLLQPFKSGSEPMPGLGPFLAAAIARLHSGSLEVQPNQGGGLRLELEIPTQKAGGLCGGDGVGN
jgi:signal transduction histidine kinase